MELKANDLRVGNYVDLYGSETQIHRSDFAICKCTHGIAVDNGKPIKLTKEWLTKFGFTLHGQDDPLDMYWTHNKIKGCIGKDNLIYNISGIKLNYVHQLQNLFYGLTGEELRG